MARKDLEISKREKRWHDAGEKARKELLDEFEVITKKNQRTTRTKLLARKLYESITAKKPFRIKVDFFVPKTGPKKPKGWNVVSNSKAEQKAVLEIEDVNQAAVQWAVNTLIEIEGLKAPQKIEHGGEIDYNLKMELPDELHKKINAKYSKKKKKRT